MNMITVLTELFQYWVYGFDNLREGIIIFLEHMLIYDLYHPLDLKEIFCDLSPK